MPLGLVFLECTCLLLVKCKCQKLLPCCIRRRLQGASEVVIFPGAAPGMQGGALLLAPHRGPPRNSSWLWVLATTGHYCALSETRPWRNGRLPAKSQALPWAPVFHTPGGAQGYRTVSLFVPGRAGVWCSRYLTSLPECLENSNIIVVQSLRHV